MDPLPLTDPLDIVKREYKKTGDVDMVRVIDEIVYLRQYNELLVEELKACYLKLMAVDR